MTTSTGQDGRSQRAEEKRKLRVREIEEAAAALFAERGFHVTSVTDVIARAGISRGTFYLYFESKEAVFLSLLARFTRDIIRAVQVVDPNGPNPTGEIAQNLERVVNVVFDNPDLTRLVFQQSLGVDDDVDAELRRLYDFLHEMLEGALQNGARAGLTRHVNEPLVATALIGGIKEVFYERLSRIEIDTSHAARAVVVSELLEFGLRGLYVRQA